MSKNSLREIVESLMISKVELAIRAKVSSNTITRIEQGMPYKIETKRKIIKALEHINSDETEVMVSFIKDNGDKRLGLDRRQYSYDKHIP
jgi:predicted transcriptional regulator